MTASPTTTCEADCEVAALTAKAVELDIKGPVVARR
jgi:hypothetical protein